MTQGNQDLSLGKIGSSDAARSVKDQMRAKQDEASFEQVAIVELALEKSRARAQRAAEALQELAADPHLIEAVERAQEELSATARRLRQGTYFAVPDPQTSIEAA
jgi:glycine/D-amino acid oxidase-like deaminating enzyme